MVTLEAFLITFIIFTITIILSNDMLSFFLLFLTVFILFKIYKIDREKAFKTVKGLKFFFVLIILLNTCFYSTSDSWFSFYFITPTSQGLWQGLKISIRTILILLYSELVLQNGSSVALSKAFVHILYPLKFLFIPIGTLSMIFSLSFSFINILNEEKERIEKAQKLRGLHFEHKGLKNRVEAINALLLPLFLSAFHKADEMSFALDSRGYNPNKKVKFERFLNKRDYQFLVLILVITILIMVGGHYVKY